MMTEYYVDSLGNHRRLIMSSSDNDCPVKSCGHLTMDACSCKATEYQRNHPGWQWKPCGHLTTTICKCDDQSAGEKKEMTAKELLNNFEKDVSRYLLGKGWNRCVENGEGGQELWIKIFDFANDGTPYAIPMVKIMHGINTALAFQRVSEEKAAEAAGVKG